MKRINICILLLLASVWVFSQGSYKKSVQPTKNLIVMIPDGTSMGVVSAARWYKAYNKSGANLNIDPYFCGTVKTHASNAPIGDSAPTTSCYMTGMPQRTGNVAIYPLADPENDLVYVDSQMAYQPLTTVLEAAKIEQRKAAGLVVTCQFPHATPADCSAHHYSRSRYEEIALQMAHQNLDVVFGSGNSYVSDEIINHFAKNNTAYIKDDIQSFRNVKSGKTWALFGEMALPYELDRNENEIPSLEEMTKKSLEILSQNENGFFLMVEGSQIDWLAHSNDAGGCIAEFLAFDNAVGAALDFAKKDGNTTVLIMPDHGNSGFTIGRYGLKYDTATLETLFGTVSAYKKTASGLTRIIGGAEPENIKAAIKEYTGIEITDEEYNDIVNSTGYKENSNETGNNKNLHDVLLNIMNQRTFFGFTSNGHTGEDVFLAAYHPQGDIPLGMNTNVEINHYLADVLGLEKSLGELTAEIFVKHTDVFAGLKYKITKEKDGTRLEVKKGRNTLHVPAFSSVACLNGKAFDMGSVAVYIDKNDIFYIPKNLAGKL